MPQKLVVNAQTGESELIEWEPPPYDPPYVPAVPILCAVAQFTLADGDISNIDMTAGFSIIFMIEPGKAWAFFEIPMATIFYTWNVNSTQGEARVTDGRTLDLIELELEDGSGQPLDMGTVALQVYKVQ